MKVFANIYNYFLNVYIIYRYYKLYIKIWYKMKRSNNPVFKGNLIKMLNETKLPKVNYIK